MKTLGLGVLATLLSTAALAQPTNDGLYAVFQTGYGAFTCRLRYDLVPRTVASFVGLAEGSQDWLDYSSGAVVHRPFYNGLTFHRVVQGFVIQGGSPNALGNDDPGYKFKDEFHPSLRHDRAGILSMANSGPHSNGSQFFVTLTATPNLDDRHSVFGDVISGMDVITAIGSVVTDTNERPQQPILIQSVSVFRVGAAASAFIPGAVTPALPTPRGKPAIFDKLDENLILHWQLTPGHEYRICYSSDLRVWSGFPLGTFNGRFMNDFASFFPHQFFQVFETRID